MSKNIKKTVKVTTVKIYKADLELETLECIATKVYVGGLGERLALSRARKEYGVNTQIKCINGTRTYRATLDDFLAIAREVKPDDVEPDEDEPDED